MLSMGEIIFLCTLLGFAAPIFIFVLSIVHSHRKTKFETWKTLAANTGLIANPESLLKGASIDGKYRGQTVYLTTYGWRPTILLITLTSKYHNDVSLFLEQRGIVNTLTKLGETTIETGNRKFDQQFFIKGHPEEAIKKIMDTDNLSRRLSKVGWRGSIKLELHNSQLRFEQPYPPPTYDDMDVYLHQLLDLLCDLVEAAEQR